MNCQIKIFADLAESLMWFTLLNLIYNYHHVKNIIINIEINYCKTEINEHCIDSDQHLEEILNWKKK